MYDFKNFSNKNLFDFQSELSDEIENRLFSSTVLQAQDLPVHTPKISLYDHAIKDNGIFEIPGKKSDPRIDYHFDNTMGHDTPYKDDTAHCAAAMNSWLKDAGYKHIASLAARDIWHRSSEIGKRVELLNKYSKRAILVLANNASTWQGHTFIYISHVIHRGGKVALTGFGANQSTPEHIKGEICTKTYMVGPNEAYRLLGCVLPERV